MTYTDARYTAAHIPGARFVGYTTGGHLLLGHWKEASSEVVEFLRRALELATENFGRLRAR